MQHDDQRFSLLTEWLSEQLPILFSARGWGEVPPAELIAASSDASFRRYFRWQSADRSFIVMDAPPPQENCEPFVRIATLLRNGGVNVPEILAQDLPRGFLLLEDLGAQTYLQGDITQLADAWFSDAIDALIKLQQITPSAEFPRYDRALLLRELSLFDDWYVQAHLGRQLNEQQRQWWNETCEVLINSALAQNTVLVHRDYMPRNLMITEPNPGVLDFQDAVVGPVSYDITSLFKDAFISWPAERVRDWLRLYWERAREAGIAVPERFEQFEKHCDLMGAQRHLKVIGIFSRICHRDGKPRYLEDAPRFFEYLTPVAQRWPELAPLWKLLYSLENEGVNP